jgi:hypothetical protein
VTEPQSHWKTVAAAVAGPTKGALGCQDAVAIRLVRAGEQQALVIALADGAGSAAQGGDAARLIVQTLLTCAVSRLRRRLRPGKTAPVWSANDMTTAFARARTAVTLAAHAHAHELRDWGSTGLLAVLTDQATWLGQIGDGAMCLRQSGTWTCPLPPDLESYVNVTSFVTHAQAPLRTHQAPAVEAVLVFSDGLQPLALDYKLAQPHAPFCQGVIAELGKSTEPRKLERDLTAWLSSDAIRARSDDDISLAMALRI